MSPFYFAERTRQLFGIYHAAKPQPGPPRAIVLCNPWGAESIHAHRTLRQAGIQLAAAGFHVLRFDYFGTGDSAGDLTGATLAMWEDDIRFAIREVSTMSGAGRVMLIGLRLGAVLAARVAASESATVDRVVLWDPLVTGSAYLDELFYQCRVDPEPFRELRNRPADVGGGYEVQGFPLTDRMARDIQDVDLGSLSPHLPVRCKVLVSAPEDEAIRVRQRLVPPLSPETVEWIPAFPCWVNQWPPVLRTLPVDFLRRLVESAEEIS